MQFVYLVFEYEGFTLNSDSVAYIESWLAYLIGLTIVPKRLEIPSDYFVSLAFFVFLCPLFVLYGYTSQSRYALFLVILQFYIMVVSRRLLRIKINSPLGIRSSASKLAVIVSVSSTIWIVVQGGFQNFNLDFSTVYDFRDRSTEIIYVGPLGYFVTWSTTVAGPFLVAETLRLRRYWMSLIVLAFHVFWFGTTSHKSVLFYPALSIFIFYSYRKFKSIVAIPIGMASVIAIVLLDFHLTENLMAPSMFVRRVFFVPPNLTFIYNEFFSREAFVFWSNSFLRGIIKYPYQEPIPLVIGGELNDSTLWANVGFFGTGYMHAGFLGVFIYAIVAGSIMSVLDSIAKSGVPTWIILSISTVPFYNLFTHSDLPTTILTHGLGFSVLLSIRLIENRTVSAKCV